MKLDKIETNQKKISKKALIIGGSTVAVITFCGITGWGFFKNSENNMVKMARSAVIGQAMEERLGSATVAPVERWCWFSYWKYC